MMKRSFLLVVTLSLCLPGSAQVSQKLALGSTCSHFGEKLPKSVFLFANDREADDAIKRIVEVSGLKKNFDIRAAGVPNAAAVIQGQTRFILYNQYFMAQTEKATANRWAAVSIMAHEVAHHLNGDTLQAGGSRPQLEIFADYFSGFVLQKMGASLDDARIAMQHFGSDAASQTHPAKTDRLAAITNGWTTSKNLVPTPAPDPRPTENGGKKQPPPTDPGFSSTCRFTKGPRAGEVQSYVGEVKPIPVGSRCTDGGQNSGVAVPDTDSARSASVAMPNSTIESKRLSSTCRFASGPKAGQTQSFIGKVQPIPVGNPCTDGVGSFGYAIPDTGAPGPVAVPTSTGGSGKLSSTCRFTSGPKAGEVQSYVGKVKPIPVGSPCTDGGPNSGVAVPDADPSASESVAVPVSSDGSEDLSSTCRFTKGPKAGKVQSYVGKVKPIPVGSPCTDGGQNSGVAVPDGEEDSDDDDGDEEDSPSKMSSTCRFISGPKAGQTQSYVGKTQPIPVGSPCTDGAGSVGTAVPDRRAY